MRIIGAACLLVALQAAAITGFGQIGAPQANDRAVSRQGSIHGHGDGQDIFRFDTFGDEQLWTDVLRMNEVIEDSVTPRTALSVGLKVDADALPAAVITAIKNNDVDLDDRALTLTLLKLNAVVGVKGLVNDAGQLERVGITCALCHSTVDNSIAAGIGRRLDGWQNSDLNVGAILSLSPAFANDPVKAEFLQWGPGRYDPRHHAFNGVGVLPLNSPTLPIQIPPIYGLKHVGFETVTADGPISYWNSYVGVGQMGGKGTFTDTRIGLSITQEPDLVTPKLPALLDYQLSLDAPVPPTDRLNRDAVKRGRDLFRKEARCSECHDGPDFTDVRHGRKSDEPLLHDPSETGMDPRYAMRTATGRYRTTPLRALVHHAPYFHDGSAPDLPSVVEHYDRQFSLQLTPAQKADLVEYLKSL